MPFVKLFNKQTSDKTLSAPLYCSFFLLESWINEMRNKTREKKVGRFNLNQEFVCLILRREKINHDPVN